MLYPDQDGGCEAGKGRTGLGLRHLSTPLGTCPQLRPRCQLVSPAMIFHWCTQHCTCTLFLGYSNLTSRELISEALNIRGSKGSRQELCFEHRQYYIKVQVPSKKSAASNWALKIADSFNLVISALQLSVSKWEPWQALTSVVEIIVLHRSEGSGRAGTGTRGKPREE